MIPSRPFRSVISIIFPARAMWRVEGENGGFIHRTRYWWLNVNNSNMGRDTSSYILYRKNEKGRMRDSGYTKSKGNCKSNVCTENYIFYLRLRIKLPYVTEWKQNKKKGEKERRFYLARCSQNFIFQNRKCVCVWYVYVCIIVICWQKIHLILLSQFSPRNMLLFL